jgi:hypothetical protein
VTTQDVSSNSIDTEHTVKALAVETDPNGKPGTPIRKKPEFMWAGAIPMSPMHLSGLTCWQVVAPLPQDFPQTLTFGLSVEFPTGLSLPQRITGYACLAPFYATAAASLASGTLPVPRFGGGFATIQITLE